MKVLHVIDSLNYGGAETLLMSYVPMMKEYNHVVVTLTGPNVYEQEGYEYMEMDYSMPKDFFRAVFGLRRIIKDKAIDIVHAHSFWTNIISRYAAPRRVALFNHYHFADYDTMLHKRAVKQMLMIDRMSKRKGLQRLAVSEYVARVLQNKFRGAAIGVVPNFIEGAPAGGEARPSAARGIRVVAVGNCNVEKNYGVVMDAFRQLKHEPVTIDIIGGGDPLETYREAARRDGLHNVSFLGYVSGVREKLRDYDLFLSSSISETFGIAVLEGIQARLPLLLSDIPAYREIAPAGTVFFDPRNAGDLAERLRGMVQQKPRIDAAAYDAVLEKYSAQAFVERLGKLYNQTTCVA